MTPSPVDVVRRAVDALNLGDVEGYMAALAPTCRRWVIGFDAPLSGRVRSTRLATA